LGGDILLSGELSRGFLFLDFKGKLFKDLFRSFEMAKKRFLSFLSKFLPEKPNSLFSSQALETFKFDNTDFGTERGKKLLYTLFRRYPLIFRAILLRSYLGVPSVKINFDNMSDSEKDKAEKVISEFLKNLHPVSGELALTNLLRDLWMNVDAFGTGFLDPIWDKKKLMMIGIKKIHPISIDLQRESGSNSKIKIDKKGNPAGWVQEILNEKKEIDFEDIAYFTFVNIGDEILGVSTLEPVYKTAWRLMNIEEGISTAIFRHGFPLYDIQVSGSVDGRPPTKEQLDSAAKQVKGLNYKSEFIHPPNYKVSLLEAFSLGKGDDYVSSFINLICSGSGIPKFMLMMTSKELSKTNAIPFIRTIPSILIPLREKLQLDFEEQILWPLMKANHIKECPSLEFGDFPISVEGLIQYVNKPVKVIPSKIDNKEGFSSSIKSESLKTLPGLYLVEPHANLIYEGDKKQIIKSEAGMKMLKKYVGKEMYLVSGKKVYGIIKLREPRQIDINDFIQLRYAHKVSDEERKEWWPEEKNLYVYEFELSGFQKLKNYKTPAGVQVLIKEINPEDFKNG